MGLVAVDDAAPDDTVGDSVTLVEAPVADEVAWGEADTDALHEAAARLCRDYATAAPETLRDRGHLLLARVNTLSTSTSRGGARSELLAIAGWTSLVTACAEYDLDFGEDAERSRRTAAWNGREAGHDEIVAWAYELGAWFALTNRRWRETIELAVAGQRIAPNTSAAIQLAAQEARAWARLGQRDRSERALARSEQALDLLPAQRFSDHHFVIDESKPYSYRLDCHRWLGDHRLTERYADEVLTRFDLPAGAAEKHRPMRVAAARLSLAVVAARACDLDAADAEAAAALAEPRRSLPWVRLLTAELVDSVLARWPDTPRSADLVEKVRAVVPGAVRADRVG